MGFERDYTIYEDGTIARVARTFKGPLTHQLFGRGYPGVFVRDPTGKRFLIYIHIGLAKAFIPNPENLPEVNHCDGVKTHYALDNLEWSTRSWNNTHKNRVLKAHHNRTFYILVSPQDEILEIDNLAEFCEIKGLNPSGFYKVLRGDAEKHMGLYITYTDK